MLFFLNRYLPIAAVVEALYSELQRSVPESFPNCHSAVLVINDNFDVREVLLIAYRLVRTDCARSEMPLGAHAFCV